MFGEQIETLARRMPWMTVEGNHERDFPDSDDRFGSVEDSGAAVRLSRNLSPAAASTFRKCVTCIDSLAEPGS